MSMSDDLQGVEDERIRTLIQDTRKEKETLAAERAQLESERLQVAFDKVGVPETGPGLMFRESYKGDPSAEAIKSAAERYGILGPPAPSSPDAPLGLSDADIARMRELQNTVGSQGQAPRRSDEVLAKMLNSESADEVMEIVRQERLVLDTSDVSRAPAAWEQPLL